MEVVKGFYESEKDLVQQIKDKVTGIKDYSEDFKTLECSIMDIADDIAYSTFDLEDSFKAEFISPLYFIKIEPEILKRVHQKVIKTKELESFTEDNVVDVLESFAKPLFKKENHEELNDKYLNSNDELYKAAGHFYYISCIFRPS